MRNVKLMAAVLVLALTGVVYAAGRAQDAPKTQEPANVAKSCCQKHDEKHDGERPRAHAGMKHEGCCAQGSCASGACSKEHKGSGAMACASGCESCCKDGAACCKDDECCKGHKADVKQTAQKPSGEKEGKCCGSSCAYSSRKG